ncbi:MAG: WD40/YVTN/BNR-like repeat-containing protein [Candidatus Anammoxibacter sp.]
MRRIVFQYYSKGGDDKMIKTAKTTSKKVVIILFLFISLFTFSSNLFAKVTVERIWSTPPAIPRSIQIDSEDSNIMYVSVGKFGVYKSTDGGNTFDKYNAGLPMEDDRSARITYLALSPVNTGYLYTSFSGSDGNFPYYSKDGGVNWNKPSVMDKGDLVNNIVPDDVVNFVGAPIAINPVDENVAITTGVGNSIQKTVDGGDTWEYSGNGYTGGKAGIGLSSIGWDTNNQYRFALFLRDFGAVLTDDGGETFRNLNAPSYKGGSSVIVGAIDPTSGSDVIIAAVGDDDKQIIAVTRNEGNEWARIGGTEGKYTFIAFHPQDPDIIYAGKFKSVDNGFTWESMEKDVIAVFGSNGDVVYASETKEGALTIFKSVDGGVNWESTYDSVEVSGDFASELVIDPNNQDRLYLTTANGVNIWDGLQWNLKSNNNGLEEGRFGSSSVRSVAVDPNNPNIIYAGKWIGDKGHANGVFMSTDYGETWGNITYNLGPEFTPWAISVNPNTGDVYVGSSHGTWFISPPVDM